MRYNKIVDYVDVKTGKFLFSEPFYDPGLNRDGKPPWRYGGRPWNPLDETPVKPTSPLPASPALLASEDREGA